MRSKANPPAASGPKIKQELRAATPTSGGQGPVLIVLQRGHCRSPCLGSGELLSTRGWGRAVGCPAQGARQPGWGPSQERLCTLRKTASWGRCLSSEGN